MWNNATIPPTYHNSTNYIYQHSALSRQYAAVPVPTVANSAAVATMPTIQQQCESSEHTNKRRRMSLEEKAQHSRERNRMHSRKSRQRKKMQVQILQNRIRELEENQRRLRQTLNDRNTANILLLMSASPEGCYNPLIDIDTIDDDGLSLNTATSSTTTNDDIKSKGSSSEQRRSEDEGNLSDNSSCSDDFPRDTAAENATTWNEKDEKGERKCLDFQFNELDSVLDLSLKLFNKNKDSCTPEEFEQIRRERNRMHSKKTRDRKKLYLEEQENIISRLEAENQKLRNSIQKLGATSYCILPVRTATNENDKNSLLMNAVSEPDKIASTKADQKNKLSDTQSDTHSESESNTSVEPGSSNSNSNIGSSRSDDSHSADDDVNGNGQEHDMCTENGSGSNAAKEEHSDLPPSNTTK